MAEAGRLKQNMLLLRNPIHWRLVLAWLVACLMPTASAWALSVPAPACPGTDRACAVREMEHYPLRTLSGWKQALAQPVEARIGPASPQLVEYLTLDNIANGFPERPREGRPDAAFMADLRAAVAGLPPAVWRLFGKRLLGIYFVENLGGTGYTDFVLDQAGNPVAGYIVLDVTVLAGQRANAWATWKENTPFKPRPGYQLQAQIEEPANDNRKNAIQYILLHELGHVLSIGGNIHPPWNLEPRKVSEPEHYPYFELSWLVGREFNQFWSRFDAAFPRRKDVVYYFGAKLDAKDMAETYSQLAGTNFPSLYAATRPGDDFAEAFASYVHVVLMRRPWSITISRDGAPPQLFKACWSEPRCAPKRKLIERLLRE